MVQRFCALLFCFIAGCDTCFHTACVQQRGWISEKQWLQSNQNKRLLGKVYADCAGSSTVPLLVGFWRSIKFGSSPGDPHPHRSDNLYTVRPIPPPQSDWQKGRRADIEIIIDFLVLLGLPITTKNNKFDLLVLVIFKTVLLRSFFLELVI